ncbi:ubiquitin carboxyl-terminal hydrolase 40-like isoform X2 [Saccostrea echinata]|uniref:ubiquitin carboxyl-terminal hydrolase 40-like isoform X2 n=1 Tax=Saccostrea echinata TaxID=191078 RepID=UPI002A825879|nr:ubiquitin carboxyl-terminal hydrolase 40-like isoform X2 [Saccostrea echinata]
MLGLEGLFAEDGEQFESALHQSKPGLPQPPSKRAKCGLCGISNQGATCYLNSLLQTLFFTTEFRDALFSLGEEELGSLAKRSSGEKVRVIPLHLQKLFARLLMSDRQSVSTIELTDSFGWTNNEELQQHDVQELNRILFSAIEDSLVGTSGKHLIKQLYHGAIVNQIVCSVCGKISEREEDFLDLSISVSGTESLEAGLRSYYCETETMEGKNQYRCENCNKLVDAKKGAKLRSLPQILTFSLLRFSFDLIKMDRYKETGKFVFPTQLDMSPYEEKSEGADLYELFSVVVHKGGAHGGHYTAYLRDVDNLGVWSAPEEGSISVLGSPESGQLDVIECDSPIELVQTILSQAPDKCLSVDKLGGEITKKTGVSWNKRFRKQYGPITKFIAKYDDKFFFDPSSNSISLKQYTSSSVMSSQRKETDIPKATNLEGDNPKKSRPPSPPPPSGYCWFHFNDSHVHPVREQELQSTYSGKSSAYMLFYRRIVNQSYNASSVSAVPASLVMDVMKENEDLQKQREAYEIELNKINLRIHFSAWFTEGNGALQPQDPQSNYLPLELDRRQSLADLLIAVMEIGGELVPENFVIHTMKELPSGYHLYSKLTGSDDVTIQSLGVGDEASLFVWDGKTVDGVTVAVGEETEPILLNINPPEGDSLIRGFPKNMLLSDVLDIACAEYLLYPNSVSMQRLVGKGEQKLLAFTSEEMSKSITELKLTNGSELFLVQESEQITRPTNVPVNVKFTVSIENRCQVNGPKGSIQLQALPTDSVSLLKALAVSKFRLPEIQDGGRLRVEHETLGLKSPLCDELTLLEAGISKDSKLVLEPGQAPKSNQITVNITTDGSELGLTDTVEMLVNRNQTVGDCLTCVLNRLRVEDPSWHLRKTNWCGEAADILNDMESTLEHSLVRDGDLLILEKGRLPPKGFICPEIWLFPILDNVQQSNKTGFLSWLSTGIQNLWNTSSGKVTPENRKGALHIGEVQVSLDSTLDDLKQQVMTLPTIAELGVPMVEFLRVRVIEDGPLTTVLKGPSQTLRKLRLQSCRKLGVQVLPQEEDLTANHIVLEIRQRIPETKTYAAGQEVVWNVSQGATAHSLKQTIADILLIPVEHILVAKHFPKKYEWLIIKEHQKKSPGKGGRKKTPQKSNLRQPPYHIQDGDVIGAKNLQFDPLQPEDFCTEEDERGQEELQRIAEDKKKEREDKKNRKTGDFDFSEKKKRPEATLSIKVDDFT